MTQVLKNLTDKEKALALQWSDKEKEVIGKLSQKKQSVLERFPLLFTMLTTFGLVATFYGFEHIIDNIELLANNPLILLGAGVGIMLFTGTLYKKLG